MWALLLVSVSSITDGIAAPCTSIDQKTCFRNSGYDLVPGADAAACCALCAADTKCAAWTFITEQLQAPNCHLKATLPNASEIQHCNDGASSVLRTPLPTPAPTPAPPAPKGAMNVVFIVVDDLRPEFNLAYDQSHLVTPKLDAFVDSSLTFTQAYVQYSHCSPSRNSFLSGRRPQTTGVYNFIDSFRQTNIVDSNGVAGIDWVAMPEWFKQHGYQTLGGGKIFHPNHPPNDDKKYSWDATSPVSGVPGYYKANGDDKGCRGNETIYDNVCPSAEPDSAFYDNVLAVDAAAQIKAAALLEAPFFVGVGMRRPHRVWHVPRRFYDLYTNNGTFPTDMKLAAHKTAPLNMPPLAWIDNAWPSFHYNYTVPISDDIAALGRWGYYAAVSFMDFNVGIVLDAIDAAGVAKNTIVVLTGDHGWELGEHGEWCKRTNFEVGVRVPLMIRSPAHAAASYGKSTPHFFESVDFYRTIASLAFNSMAPVVIEKGVEGTDLSSIFADVEGVTNAPLKSTAFSQMARCPAGGVTIESACNSVKRVDIEYMGYSVRVKEWRYTAWIKFNGTLNRGIWPSTLNTLGDSAGDSAGVGENDDAVFIADELYSHEGDFGMGVDAMDKWENENVAGFAANAATRASLLAMLKAEFETPPTEGGASTYSMNT